MILLRYLFLLILSLFILSKPFASFILIITIYPVHFILGLFYQNFVVRDLILVGNISVELIPACLAISAYLLLFALNFLVSMRPLKRILALLFSSTVLLIANIIRIFILTLFVLQDSAYYDIIHEFIWYFLSTALVVAIWFLTAYLFNIKEIPLYSDIKSIKKSF